MPRNPERDKAMNEDRKNPAPPNGSRVQGEGDYVSGKRFQEDEQEFVESHDTAKLAREAEPKSEAERREMEEAENRGKARAKGKKKPADERF
jgi:hypothetical protein